MNDMKKNFFRKVGFGIGPDEIVPDNPVSWAQNQVDKVPPLIWDTRYEVVKKCLTITQSGYIQIEKF